MKSTLKSAGQSIMDAGATGAGMSGMGAKGAAAEERKKPQTSTMAMLKKKAFAYEKKEHGIQIIEKQIHKGWITKIKFYHDLNYIVSASLDGFIHIHDIEDLSYKENKTFNLH